MAHKNNIAIVVLIGLPGCGKTTFTMKLMDSVRTGSNGKKFEMLHISYDQIYYSMKQDVSYKEFRKQNVEYIKRIITVLKKTDYKSDELYVLLKSSGLNKFHSGSPNYEPENYCVVIDDNMYYRSMRFEIFNVSKTFNTGFMQVYVDCGVETALRNNSKRIKENCLPDDVILKMSTRIEKPNALQFPWEKCTQVLSSENGFTDNDINSFFDIIEQTLRNPVMCDRENSTNKSKVQCLQSTVHHCDLAIRKLISKHITNMCNSLSHSGLKSLSCSLLKIKENLLIDIRTGKILIPDDIILIVGQDDFQDKLQSYLKQYLESKLQFLHD